MLDVPGSGGGVLSPTHDAASEAAGESDIAARIEIVHALAAHGGTARATLTRIAQGDPDAAVRGLAQFSVDSIK